MNDGYLEEKPKTPPGKRATNGNKLPASSPDGERRGSEGKAGGRAGGLAGARVSRRRSNVGHGDFSGGGCEIFVTLNSKRFLKVPPTITPGSDGRTSANYRLGKINDQNSRT